MWVDDSYFDVVDLWGAGKQEFRDLYDCFDVFLFYLKTSLVMFDFRS